MFYFAPPLGQLEINGFTSGNMDILYVWKRLRDGEGILRNSPKKCLDIERGDLRNMSYVFMYLKGYDKGQAVYFFFIAHGTALASHLRKQISFN